MEHEKFKKATHLLRKQEFADKILTHINKTGNIFISVGDIDFMNFNPGEIRIKGDSEGEYFPELNDFNTRVVSEFKQLLVVIIEDRTKRFHAL